MGCKKNVLIIMGRFLPGYKDGGPVRSIKNLVDFLGDEFNFMILTSDRDHGDTKPYPKVKVNDWNKVGKAKVYYVPPKCFSFRTIKKLSNSADIVYVCGCFNDYSINALLLKRLGLIKKPLIIAAMGLFSPMEFRLKYKKKKLFTIVFNKSGLLKNIFWSATSEMEINEIKQQIKTNDNFFIAEDLPRKLEGTSILKQKEEGKLKVVWISRITPKKNLMGAIQILKRVKSDIEFTIYGPVHVQEYWNNCKSELSFLPSNITWNYAGNLKSEQVVETLKRHHVFLFPTFGENYGHVIQEALSAGCPCILSDQTPWQDLEVNNAGFVFPLTNIDSFIESIDKYVSMNEKEYNFVSKGALEYIMKTNKQKINDNGYRLMFNSL